MGLFFFSIVLIFKQKTNLKNDKKIQESISIYSGLKFLLIISPLLIILAASIPFIYQFFSFEDFHFPYSKSIYALVISLMGNYLCILSYFLNEND